MNAAFTAHQAGQRVNLLQKRVPKGFVELQEQFVDQKLVISDSLRESDHMLTWGELK